MCGRFVQVEKPEFYAEHFGAEFVRTETLKQNYNVAPTNEVYAVAEHDGDRVLTSFRWGLVPFWAKDVKIGAKSINARVETAATKPTFRDSFAKRRCLVPVDGFYEWQRKDKGKLPHYIHGADDKPLALAGLWSSWTDPETDERLLTCTVITGTPNELVEPIHDRMPMILPPERWAGWLDRENRDVDDLQAMLTTYPSELMAEHPVSTLVNKVANNTPDLIEPLETPAVDAS
ncbi:MAG: SOS response-associated peptidase [Acidimicrobiia bacterium]|nr:SOS response-associated peptidase [Acidimicrobiia bacterium]